MIQEAVACYRAGAFRSCIVATWNAVVFDFLHKLRELDILGNGEAANLLKNFEKISSEAKVKELWQFESSIPDWALTKFELISPIEKSDIQRLFEDRSRCAHPSMTSLEEPFEATAELARYHLRSAVMHLLQRPPVQGRAAAKRIFQDIESEYFPVDVELAVQYFQKSLLARARFILIKDIILGLTISLLTDKRLNDERARQFSALNAIVRLYPQQTGKILNDGLSDIILNKVTDANWDKVIAYLSSVSAWEYLSEPCQLKAKAFIEKLDIFDGSSKSAPHLSAQNIDILIKSSHISFLKEIVINKLNIPLKHLLSAKALCKDQKFIDNILTPLLQDALPQADLNDLIDMRKGANELFSTAIQPHLQEAIQTASIETLIDKISKYLDSSILDLIELCLREKISTASLGELLKINAQDKLMEKLNPDLLELFDHTVKELVNQATFYELFEEFNYWNKIPDKLLEPILKENVDIIVNQFIQSSSFNDASHNARLLVKVVEFLNPAQWQYILDAFCSNDQIYRSNSCPGIFCKLFEKSMEFNGSVAPYWLSFRQKLDQLNVVNTTRLKHLIDSYRTVDF
ncbi:hypothetical protein [Scytonema sp. NUACC21]